MQKASFYKLKPDGSRDGRGISVMFNPDSYSVSSSAVYAPSFSPQSRKEILQFSNVKARTLSMTLTFDSMNAEGKPASTKRAAENGLKDVFRGKTSDVRSEVESLRSMIELTDGGKSPPPVVEFQWGGFVFRGVVSSFKEEYKMFYSDGRPIRASVSVSMTEHPYGTVKLTEKPTPAQKNADGSIESSQEESFGKEAEKALKKAADER